MNNETEVKFGLRYHFNPLILVFAATILVIPFILIDEILNGPI